MSIDKICGETAKTAGASKERVIVSETKLSFFQSQIEKLNEKILALIDDEDESIEFENNYVLGIYEKVSEALGTLKAHSSVFSVKTENASAADFPEHSFPEATRSTVRLLKLESKKFSGDDLEWQEVWEMLDIFIDNSEVQKFVHLKSLLVREAAMCIANID